MIDHINVTNNNLYLFILNLITSVETQLIFNEATQNSYTISYDELVTERRVVSDLLVQHYIGSTQQVNSPKYSISSHQTKHTILTHSKNNIIAIFDNLDLRKFYVEIDGQLYPRDGISINYTEIDYIDQYRDIKLFFKEYIGEPIMNPLISYPDRKTKYSIGNTDLGRQPDLLTFKKIQLFQEYGTDPDKTRYVLLLIKRREIELISDGNKIFEVRIIYMINTAYSLLAN